MALVHIPAPTQWAEQTSFGAIGKDSTFADPWFVYVRDENRNFRFGSLAEWIDACSLIPCSLERYGKVVS